MQKIKTNYNTHDRLGGAELGAVAWHQFCFSFCSLWVFSGCTGFLRQFKDLQISSTVHVKLPVSLNASVNGGALSYLKWMGGWIDLWMD